MDKPEVVDSETGAVSKTPTEPWIVFTAGTMVRILNVILFSRGPNVGWQCIQYHVGSLVLRHWQHCF